MKTSIAEALKRLPGPEPSGMRTTGAASSFIRIAC